MLRPAVAAAVLIVALAFPLAAQLSEVQPGARVRVEAAGIVAGTFAGTVLSRTADTLVLGGPNIVPIHIPFARISTLEISRGKSRTDGAINGIKWGVPIMAATGATLAIAVAARYGDNSTPALWPDRPRERRSVGEAIAPVAIFALAGGIYGAGIGAIIGREHWDAFDLARRTSLHFDRGRVGLQIGF